MTTYTGTENLQTVSLIASGDTFIMDGPFSDDLVDGGDNNYVVIDTSGSHDTFHLGNGANVATLDLSDTLIAGDGNDTVSDPSGAFNVIALGAGANTVTLHNFDYLQAGLFGTAERDTVTLGLSDTVILGDGGNTLSGLAVGDNVSLGGGDNTVTLSPHASNDLFSFGGGDDTLLAGVGGRHVVGASNITIDAGAGDDLFRLENSSGNFTLSQAPGTGVDTIDLTNGNFSTVDLTIGNRADVIEVGDDSIAHFTINVAVDGFKLPDGDYAAQYTTTDFSFTSSPTANVVNYVDTDEVINAAYAQAAPLPYFIDKLEFSPAPHWGNQPGVTASLDFGHALTLDFSFMQSLPSYALGDGTGFAPLGPDLPAGLTPSQLLADNSTHLDGVSLSPGEVYAVTAMDDWMAVANVTYISEPDSDPSVEVRIGSNDQGSESGGYSYVPFPDISGANELEAGDVYINNDAKVEPLSDYGRVFIHEFGHVIGLGGESGDLDPYDILPGGVQDDGGGEDSAVYTVMSYDNPPGNSNTPVTTPQIFDIAVAQYLYGANPNYDPNPSGVWTFSGTPYNPNVTRAQNTTNLIDGAGGPDDVIAAGSWSGVGYIDLSQGHWSWLGAPSTNVLAADQLFIDYGTVVDGIDAHLTSGSMTLVGNDDDDSIVCGTGNDLVVVAGTGTDIVAGGLGADTVLFAAARIDYTIAAGPDDIVTVTANSPGYGGTVVLTNVADLEFTDRTVASPAPLDLANLTSAQFSAVSTTQFGALTAPLLNTLSTTQAALLTTGDVAAFAVTQMAGLSLTLLDGLAAGGIGGLTAPQVRVLTTSQISNLAAPALAGLTASAVAALSESQIGALSTAQFDGLAASQFGNLAPASLGLLTATELQSLTATQIGELTVTQLQGMRVAALATLTSTEATELSTTQLAGLNAAAIHGLGATNLDAMSSTQLAALTTAQFAGLNATAIAGLGDDDLLAFTSTRMAGLTLTQVNALTATEIGVLTGAQLSGLTTGAMATLTTTQVAGIAFAAIGAFSSSQIAALATSAIGALGQVQIYGLTTREVAALTASQVRALTPDELLGLSPVQFSAFTSAQLAAMSSAQYAVAFG